MKFEDYKRWYDKMGQKNLFHSVYFQVGDEESTIQSFYISILRYVDEENISLAISIGESKCLPQNVYSFFRKQEFDNIEDSINFGKLECSKINRFFDSYK